MPRKKKQQSATLDQIVLAVLVLAFISLFSFTPQEERPTRDTDTLPPTPVRFVPGDEVGTTCAIGQRYERDASHREGCTCPEGYRFDIDIIGYNACYGPGSECPILTVECVPQ